MNLRLYTNLVTIFFLAILFMGCEFLDESINDPDIGADSMNSAYPMLKNQQNIYVGVINPITINVADEDDTTLLVTASNMQITKTGDFTYEAVATQPGTAQLIIDGVNFDNPIKYEYNIKRIPDPVAYLGSQNSGSMPAGQFRAQGGVVALLDGFDYDASCEIIGFELVYIARRSDPIQVANIGATYTASASNLINRARPGDIYIFNNVRARCPGDAVSRQINSMAFFIR